MRRRAYKKAAQNSRAVRLPDLVQKGGCTPGVETPVTHDAPDAGDVVEGVGEGDLASGSSSASFCSVVSGYVMNDRSLFQEQVLGDDRTTAARLSQPGQGT